MAEPAAADQERRLALLPVVTIEPPMVDPAQDEDLVALAYEAEGARIIAEMTRLRGGKAAAE